MECGGANRTPDFGRPIQYDTGLRAGAVWAFPSLPG